MTAPCRRSHRVRPRRRATLLVAAAGLLLPSAAAAEQAGSALRGLQAGALDAGSTHTCAVTDEGGIACWGTDADGQLGDGLPYASSSTAVRVALPAGRSGVAVSAGYGHVCAVLDDDSVWCWGFGASGQRGDGTIGTRSAAPVRVALSAGARAISAGELHSCAVLVDGSAWCWGNDLNGQLGDGPPLARSPLPVRVALPDGRRAAAISAGNTHTCAILDDGSAWCWGENGNGQLGDGTTVSRRSLPSRVALPAGTRAVAVSAGVYATCATLDTGASACWGEDSQGAVGNGPPFAAVPLPADIGLGAGFALTSAGHACLAAPYATNCWGDDFHGQLGNGTDVGTDQAAPGVVLGIPSARAVVALTAGGTGNAATAGGHTCAAYDDGSVWCWGDDTFAQLGNGPLTTGDIASADGGAPALPAGSVTALLADLSLTAQTPAGAPGRSAQVEVRLRNAGPDTANGVAVSLTPSALTMGGATPSQGAVDGPVWNAGTIAPGGEAVLRVTATPDGPAAAELVAEVTAMGAPPASAFPSTADPDSSPGNAVRGEDDLATVTFPAVATVPPPAGGGTVTGSTGARCVNPIRGTNRGERLLGTARGDRITGRAGPDRLVGRAGADCLHGGAGGDALTGGPGADLLDGGPGRDLIRARDGVRDVVRCGPGRDTAIVDRRDAVTGCEIVVRR